MEQLKLHIVKSTVQSLRKNWETLSFCCKTINEARHNLTSSATSMSVPAGPYVGITEVPSAYHVALFPDTSLLRSISSLLSFKGVPRVTIRAQRQIHTVNIKGTPKFRQSCWCSLACGEKHMGIWLAFPRCCGKEFSHMSLVSEETHPFEVLGKPAKLLYSIILKKKI